VLDFLINYRTKKMQL